MFNLMSKGSLRIVWVAVVLILLHSCQKESGPEPTPDTRFGDLIWEHTAPYADSLTIAPSLAIGQNGDLYYAMVGDSENQGLTRIVSLKTDSGEVNWISDPLGSKEGLNSQIMVGDDNSIYAACGNMLYAIDHVNGGIKWEWDPGPWLRLNELCLTRFGDIIISTSKKIYCFSSTGEEIWTSRDGLDFGSQHVLHGYFNTAFYFDTDAFSSKQIHRVNAINTQTGAKLWEHKLDRYVKDEINRSAIDQNGDLFCSVAFLDSQFRTHILKRENGEPNWSSDVDALEEEKYVASDGTLIEGRIPKVLDSVSGARMDLFPSEMGVCLNNERLLTTYTSVEGMGTLAIIDLSGSILDSRQVDGILSMGIKVSDDEVIFAQVQEDTTTAGPTKIIALQGNGVLAKTGWPSKHHDIRNTNNAAKY